VAQAPLWGFGRSLSQEHPAFWGGLVDLDPGEEAAASAARLAGQILTAGAETQVAWRSGVPHGARLARRRDLLDDGPAPRWRPDGTYLVTGGLGGLGLEVARFLVERGARRLILLGRTRLPPRRTWNGLDPESRVGRQVAVIRGLEARGASVHLAAVDVADEAQLAEFLAGFRDEGWPPVRGVVHAAGVLQDQAVLQLDAAAFAAVFRAKVVGAWLLHRLLDREPLDFFVLFSSAAALLGSAGQANYAAANAFLDALAHYRRARGLPATAINWGAWGEVGLAAKIDRGARLARRGLAFFTPRQGIAALERILARGDVQAAFVPFSLAEWQRFYPVAARLPKFSRLAAGEAPAAAAGTVGEQLRAVPREERGAGIERYLRDAVARVLGLAPARVDLDRPITRMGLDSLMAVEVRNRIEADLGLRLSMVTLLRGPSLAELSAQVLTELPEAPGEPAPAADSLLATVETMDEAALDNLLAELLEQEEAAP
jgi:NAD(P)-dependent dehydrogenase (short-subunit alcohol dehydrogenase family)/acyl carrier protein